MDAYAAGGVGYAMAAVSNVVRDDGEKQGLDEGNNEQTTEWRLRSATSDGRLLLENGAGVSCPLRMTSAGSW